MTKPIGYLKIILITTCVISFNMSFLIEFWNFVKIRKKYWLLPIMFVLLLFGGLIVLSKGSAIAPFIYTIF